MEGMNSEIKEHQRVFDQMCQESGCINIYYTHMKILLNFVLIRVLVRSTLLLLSKFNQWFFLPYPYLEISLIRP